MSTLKDIDTQNVPDETPAAAEPSWFIDDNTPGQGDRPEWLQSNFKSLAEQAKAYPELRKVLGAQQGAPEKYELGELAPHFPEEHPVLKDFESYAREAKLSQDAYSRVLKTMVDYVESSKPDLNKEVEKLGQHGMQKIKATQNFIRTIMPESADKVLESIPLKAELVEFFDNMRQRYVSSQNRVPGTTEPPTFKKETAEEIEREMEQNYDRYQNDPAYREKIHQRFNQALGE